MLISGREAVRILLTRGEMTGEAQARALLRAGAAGPGVVTGPGVLFEQNLVHALADRPWLGRAAQEAASPFGVYIARLSRAAVVDLTRPWTEIAGDVERVPPMPLMTTALLELTIRAAQRLPWVATLHGFVVFGADLTGLDAGETGGSGTTGERRDLRFRLEPPGDWFDTWREHRMKSTRGGRPWLLRRARAS